MVVVGFPPLNPLPEGGEVKLDKPPEMFVSAAAFHLWIGEKRHLFFSLSRFFILRQQNKGVGEGWGGGFFAPPIPPTPTLPHFVGEGVKKICLNY